ncbi:MAG: hypothetical protein OEY99_06910 [Aigarchaeota archaeon]|nr:hypothetical protein [Aigarchaeota archaeon]
MEFKVIDRSIDCHQFEKWAWTATGGWNPITRVVTSFALTRIGSKRILNELEEIGRKKQQEFAG